MKIQVNVQDNIQKPVHEVYEAIVKPEEMSGYFISRASKGMEKEETIVWYFDDFGVEFAIHIKKIEANKSVSFEWMASGDMARVDIILEAVSTNKTVIKITESDWDMTEKGVAQALQQTQGWTDFICSLKAYLYTGINLRNWKF